MMKQIIIGIGLVAAVGCVDQTAIEDGPLNTITAKQAVVVVPEFGLANVDRISEDMAIDKLGLSISELRFEPLQTDGSLAYTTREAIQLDFDVSADALRIESAPIELPEPGRYLISMRLEPNDEERLDTFSMTGTVREQLGADRTGQNSDGRPQPVPFDDMNESEWTPFVYSSRRTVFYTFNDVELNSGEQSLSFDFNTSDWSLEVVDSISKAVRNTGVSSEDGVDVTKTVDGSGDGIERLMEAGVVRSRTR